MAQIKQTPEFSKAASRLTCSDIFFTTLLYNMKIEPKDDLPHAAGTDGVTLYYQPERFAKEFTEPERVFVLVHELLHVVLFHCLRRGIRDPKRWNIACDHVVNLLCTEYQYAVSSGCYCDAQYKGMTAEQVYDKLPVEKDDGKPESGKGEGKLGGDVMDYDPASNDGKSKGDVEREVAIGTEKAAMAAKAAGQMSSGLKRLIGEAQVEHEPWYQHLRRYMTNMNARQYNWGRIDARRAVMYGVISPQQKTDAMGKLVFGIDCSGSVTAKQLSAMAAHITDLLRDVTPSEVVIAYFDSKVCHVETFNGPDYNVTLEPHGGGGTDFAPVFEYVDEYHGDAQVVIMFTDLYGNFGEGNNTCDTLWVSQTEKVEVPFGELIYGDLNEN